MITDYKPHVSIALVKIKQTHDWAWRQAGYKHASDWTRALRGDIPLDFRRLENLGPQFLVYFFSAVLEDVLVRVVEDRMSRLDILGNLKPRAARVEMNADLQQQRRA